MKLTLGLLLLIALPLTIAALPAPRWMTHCLITVDSATLLEEQNETSCGTELWSTPKDSSVHTVHVEASGADPANQFGGHFSVDFQYQCAGRTSVVTKFSYTDYADVRAQVHNVDALGEGIPPGLTMISAGMYGPSNWVSGASLIPDDGNGSQGWCWYNVTDFYPQP